MRLLSMDVGHSVKLCKPSCLLYLISSTYFYILYIQYNPLDFYMVLEPPRTNLQITSISKLITQIIRLSWDRPNDPERSQFRSHMNHTKLQHPGSLILMIPQTKSNYMPPSLPPLPQRFWVSNQVTNTTKQ